ncbi:unnamed protein product, partial [Bubo scandiacus]
MLRQETATLSHKRAAGASQDSWRWHQVPVRSLPALCPVPAPAPRCRGFPGTNGTEPLPTPAPSLLPVTTPPHTRSSEPLTQRRAQP